MRLSIFNQSKKDSHKGSYESVFKQVYKDSYAKIYKLVFYLCQNSENTKDILSEFYLKLWDKQQDFGTINNLENYLLVAVRNETFNFLKKNNRVKFNELNELSITQAAQEATPEEHIFHQETKQQLIRAIEELPEKRKLVFKLNRLEDKSTKEIALHLNISIKTVEDHITKSLQFLRKRYPHLCNS